MMETSDISSDTGPTENGDKLLNDSVDEAGEDHAEDPELEAIKARVREMEEEAEKLKLMQSEAEKQLSLGTTAPTVGMSLEEKMEVDNRSVHVGNVDYGATAEELEQHFHGCGSINRVTILCDKFTGHPKGFAYIEFSDKESIQMAMALDQSLFRGRQIKVSFKRTNRPGISTTNRLPRGRFRRTIYRSYSGYRPMRRPRRSSSFSFLSKQPS
ncbi:PABPN1 [Cordylochernes scorpioides]|uniref:PABPN1 n=1 Tax=Cordylochernes scorpioides TaxID=51811 RepID=A0ABY6KBE2_9ARAC|nr:PABPN1 [Cordylochernes scorpioides]